MKFYLSDSARLALFSLGVLGLAGCHQQTTATKDLKTDEEKVSYAIGVNVGKGMKQDHFVPNADLIARGVEDATKDQVALTPEELRTVMISFQQRLRTEREAEMKAQGEKNEKAGEAFLAANKTRPGVQTTASGLQYEVITSGKGKTPKPTDTVSLNYRATLIDGTEFDNTQKQGRPMVRPLRSVMPGWMEALQMMKEGDKWKLYIPSNLAFGPRAISQQVGPNSTLIYEMELTAVNPPPQAQSNLPMMNGRPGFSNLPPGTNLPPGMSMPPAGQGFRPQPAPHPLIFQPAPPPGQAH